MNLVFYLSAVVAIISTVMVITRPNAMHALLYLVVSFLAMSLLFYTLGAPFVAVLEVIVYAGAIMVLFIFGIMLLNLGPQSAIIERQWLKASGWIGPVVLSVILLGELIYVLLTSGQRAASGQVIDPRQVGAALFSTYLIGVELASILLLASLVGAYHLGQFRRMEDTIRQQRMIEAKNIATERGVPEETPGLITQKEP